jgi:hypothetical protein
VFPPHHWFPRKWNPKPRRAPPVAGASPWDLPGSMSNPVGLLPLMASKQTFAELAGGSEAGGFLGSTASSARTDGDGVILRVGVTITNEGASRWLEVGI